MNVLATIRKFRTEQFRVIVDAIEDYDMDLSWDEDGSVLRKLESGEYVAFCARARVIHDELGEIASDYLGGCIYADIAEFQDHRECAAQTRKLRAEEGRDDIVCGSYFSDMVSAVCEEARAEVTRLRSKVAGLYVRAA
ncbi:MAG TPA: hypothetical protein VMR74_12730 [Gammaproteobacteria bacterium]|nr:hypothetical protein [Gammaproteobacteria bacterium]